MDAMDYSLDIVDFAVKYGQDHPEVTGKEARAKYEEYKIFYATYHQDHPGATTDCYNEFLIAQGKQEELTTQAGSHRTIAESDIDVAIIEAFDKSIYMNPRNFDLPRSFLEALNRHHSESQKSERYAPYVALIQSSGYGKTRLISEIAEKVFVIYLCFREQASTGYPKATPLANELISIMREAEQPTWFDLFITAILMQARKTITNLCPNPKDFWNFQMNQDNARGFWIEVINQIKSSDLSDVSHFLKDIKLPDASAMSLKIVLCLDEARVLVQHENREKSLLRHIRRSLQRLRLCGFFCVMLDTLATVSNFAPSKRWDPSLRKTTTPLDLFPPFTSVITFDVLAKSKISTSQDRYFYGRPLFAALLSKGVSVREVISIAAAKLCGGQSLLDGKLPEDHMRRIAISVATVSTLISLDISPQSQLAHLLVGSHMATCIGVSKDRARLLVTYPSEPILAEGAFYIIQEYAMLVEILRVFGDSLKNGFVEAGHRGEIVARLVLILCWRQCVRKKASSNYTTTVKLKAFLKVLLGNSSAADVVVQKIGKELLDGKLFFTHFIPLQETPSQQTLRKLWKRCAAGILKRNQRGADILLVLKLGNNNFTFVIIQVKNRNVQLADSKYKDDSTWKLTTRYVFQETDLHDCKLPYLCVYWQLGASESRTEFVEWNFDSGRHISVFGLALSSFLKVPKLDVFDALSAILEAYIDPFDDEWKDIPEEPSDVRRFKVERLCPQYRFENTDGEESELDEND